MIILFTLVFFASLALFADAHAQQIKISGVIIAMIGGMLMSNLGFIPAIDPIYGIVWKYFIPIAIPILLFNAHFKTIKREAGKFLFAYLFGMFGTILGALVIFYILTLHSEYWKIISTLTGSYIGGSVNFVSVANSLKFEDKSLLSCTIAIDNIMMVIYFILLSLLTKSHFLNKYYPEQAPIMIRKKPASSQLSIMNMRSIITALLIASTFYLIAWLIAPYLPIQGGLILLVTAFSLILANSVPGFCSKLKNAEPIANFAMMVFFVVIGASSDISHIFTLAPAIFCIVFFLLFFQLTITLIGGYLTGCSLAQIILACNANAGGPATASAMAASNPKWVNLRAPAILCGILGYSIGSFIGIMLAHLFVLSA